MEKMTILKLLLTPAAEGGWTMIIEVCCALKLTSFNNALEYSRFSRLLNNEL